MPWMMFRAPVRCDAFLSSFYQDDEAAVSRQQLNVLRKGFAEHGEGWLRDELAKQTRDQLHGVAGAAGVQRQSAGRKLSKPELLEALSRCIAQEEASWGIDYTLNSRILIITTPQYKLP